MTFETFAASRYSLVQLADLLNAGYENYAIPVAFDAVAIGRRIIAEHIDLGASHVLVSGNEPCGVMLVARRGATSRLAALGIAKTRRGQGIGRQAVALAQAEAAARGDSLMTLEVITTNLAAQRTYAACGFTVTRQLVGYERAPVAAAAPGDDYEFCTAEEVLPSLTRAMPAGLSWQIAPASLAGILSPARGLRLRDGMAAAFFDASGPAPRLLSFGVAPEARRQGLGTALIETLVQSAPGPWRISALVPETLVDGFLTGRGWQRSALAQFEMTWTPSAA